MKILVLGGTGAIGKFVVEILAEKGYKIYVTTRSERKNVGSNITYLTGDALDIKFIEQTLMERYDVIIDFMVYRPDEFQKHSKMLLENTNQYIFISSARVYADSPDKLITEDTPRLLDTVTDEKYLTTSEYALAKAREENILLDGKYKNYTIVRPYITYSNERIQLGIYEKEFWLQRALEGKSIVFSKKISEHYTTLTNGYDVSLRIADLVGNPKAVGEIFQITTNENIKWGDVLEVYLDVLEEYLGKKPKVYLTKYSDPITEQTNYYQVHYDRIYNRKFDNEKIQKVTNRTSSFIEIREGLETCLIEFLSGKQKFIYRDWKLEAIFDRLCGEKTSIEKILGVKNKIKYLVYRYFPDCIYLKGKILKN
jgi:nucleoside-diphosphate-sugar epimerase